MGRVEAVLDAPAKLMHPELAHPGHTFPDPADLIAYDLDSAGALASLTDRHQVEVAQGRSSHGNVLALHRGLKLPACRIRMQGSDGLVILGRNASVIGELNTGDESVVVVTGQPGGRMLRLKVTLRDCRERLFWGAGSSAEGFATSVKGDDVAVIVADDCMVSWGVWARPYDMHLIIDPLAGEVLNKPRDVIVGPHVWIGQGSLLMSGSRVGAGSIVGANTVVTRNDHPAMGLHVGQPARTIRTDVTWDRESRPSPEAIQRARDVYSAYGPGAVEEPRSGNW